MNVSVNQYGPAGGDTGISSSLAEERNDDQAKRAREQRRYYSYFTATAVDGIENIVN